MKFGIRMTNENCFGPFGFAGSETSRKYWIWDIHIDVFVVVVVVVFAR